MYLLKALSFSRVLIWVMRVDTRARAQKLRLFPRQSSKAVQFLYLLGCAEEPTFLQFYAGMLKDVSIHLLCIYSCIGSEVLRAIFPFTLLDL